MPQPPGPLLSIDTLVRRAVGGEREAFAEIYERYVTRIYRYIYFLTGSAPDVEDLTAQTFLQAWRRIQRFEPRGYSVGPWLLRIAHNVTVSHLRRRHKERQGIPLDYRDPGRDADPALRLEEQSDADRLRVAIMSLTPIERDVIILRFVDGLSYAETAEALGRKVNAVRVAQWRALMHLRGILSSPEKQEILVTRNPRR